MVCFTCDIYFEYLKKNCQKIICFYPFYSLFVDISISQSALAHQSQSQCLKGLVLAGKRISNGNVMAGCTSKISLHSPDFLSFTEQLLVFIFFSC